MKIEEDMVLDKDGKTISYALNILDKSGKLYDINAAIQKLQKEKRDILDILVKEISIPEGWQININYDKCSYNTLSATVSSHIWVEKAEPAPITEFPHILKLQSLSKFVDIKTLLHTNILSTEEKRELLGLKKL